MNSSASPSSLPLVAPPEQLGVAGDRPQRLLEVVRGDVGELLELGVRTSQLGDVASQALLGPLSLDALGDSIGHDRQRFNHVVGELMPSKHRQDTDQAAFHQ